MKIIPRMLSILVAVAMAVSLTNCGDDDDGGSSEEEAQLGKLVGTWTLSSASLDGTDRTTDFPGLTLTVSGTFSQGGTYAYSFTGTRPNPSPWPASGTWKFDANPSSQIIRLDDGQKMNYSLGNSNAQLTIEFNYQGSGFAGGRIEEVAGNWQFVFTK
ncbi:MAG TPA: lipocalin family protein [Cyclobacteriaceae bacterium]